MTIVKTAAIQMKVWEDKFENITNLENYLIELSQKQVDLVILPEMFNCPYDTANFPIYAEKEGGAFWKEIAKLAQKYSMYLVAGSVPEEDNDKVYNTSYIFNPNGKQIGKHRKMHLFDIAVENGQTFKESDTLSSGNEVTVVETEFGKIGICICYDFRFPELARLMVDKGAEMIIVPGAFNMTTGPAHWRTLFQSRAIDNQVFTIGAAPSRDLDSSYLSWGHTLMVSPWGEILEEMEEKPGYIIQDIDLSQVTKTRTELPLLKHRRNDIYELKLK